MSSRNLSSQWAPLGPIGVLDPLKSNFEIDSTFHYRESTAFRYPMYITMKHCMQTPHKLVSII